MRQSDLIRIVMSMKVGQAYVLTREDMLGCAEGMLTSMLDGPPRQSDIDNFIKQSSDNWDIEYAHDVLKGTYTIHKKISQKRTNTGNELSPKIIYNLCKIINPKYDTNTIAIKTILISRNIIRYNVVANNCPSLSFLISSRKIVQIRCCNNFGAQYDAGGWQEPDTWHDVPSVHLDQANNYLFGYLLRGLV